MLEVVALTVLVLLVWAAFSVAVLLLKLLLWLVLLPLRLLFGLLLVPILALKFILGGIVTLVLLPVLAIVAMVGLLAAAAGLIIPLFPILLLASGIWLLVRLTRPVTSPTRA